MSLSRSQQSQSHRVAPKQDFSAQLKRLDQLYTEVYPPPGRSRAATLADNSRLRYLLSSRVNEDQTAVLLTVTDMVDVWQHTLDQTAFEELRRSIGLHTVEWSMLCSMMHNAIAHNSHTEPSSSSSSAAAAGGISSSPAPLEDINITYDQINTSVAPSTFSLKMILTLQEIQLQAKFSLTSLHTLKPKKTLRHLQQSAPQQQAYTAMEQSVEFPSFQFSDDEDEAEAQQQRNKKRRVAAVMGSKQQIEQEVNRLEKEHQAHRQEEQRVQHELNLMLLGLLDKLHYIASRRPPLPPLNTTPAVPTTPSLQSSLSSSSSSSSSSDPAQLQAEITRLSSSLSALQRKNESLELALSQAHANSLSGLSSEGNHHHMVNPTKPHHAHKLSDRSVLNPNQKRRRHKGIKLDT